jgi:hypothetical protein
VIAAEFPGFQTGVLKDVRIRAGDNKHVIVLALETLQDSVTGRPRRAGNGSGPAEHVWQRTYTRAG